MNIQSVLAYFESQSEKSPIMAHLAWFVFYVMSRLETLERRIPPPLPDASSDIQIPPTNSEAAANAADENHDG